MKKLTQSEPQPYLGDLATPIVLPPAPSPGTFLTPVPDDERRRSVSEWRNRASMTTATAHLRKLSLLLDHYSIDRADNDCWLHLATALAIAHVPGFQTGYEDDGPKVGRNRLWNSGSYAQLWMAVWWMCRKEGVSESAACQRLALRTVWSKRGSAETLRRKLADAKRDALAIEMVAMMERVFLEMPDIDMESMVTKFVSGNMQRPTGGR